MIHYVETNPVFLVIVFVRENAVIVCLDCCLVGDAERTKVEFDMCSVPFVLSLGIEPSLFLHLGNGSLHQIFQDIWVIERNKLSFFIVSNSLTSPLFFWKVDRNTTSSSKMVTFEEKFCFKVFVTWENQECIYDLFLNLTWEWRTRVNKKESTI